MKTRLLLLCVWVRAYVHVDVRAYLRTCTCVCVSFYLYFIASLTETMEPLSLYLDTTMLLRIFPAFIKLAPACLV